MTKRILLIDDDATIRRAYRRILKTIEGDGVLVEIVVAETCELGLQALQSAAFDLVVTDNDTGTALLGLQLIQMLRASGNRVPIILIASEGPRMDREELLALIATDQHVVWHPKPGDAHVLCDTARRHLTLTSAS